MMFVSDVMALPPEDRLPYALQILQDIACEDADRLSWVATQFDVTPTAARILLMLNRVSPGYLTAQNISTALHRYGDDVFGNSVQVYICHLRKIGIKIETRHGIGYRLVEPMEVGRMAPRIRYRSRQGSPWRQEDDEALRAMMESRSCVCAIAEELDRTERGVLERWARIRGRR